MLAAIQLALIWNHEPWEDELQALLIARDSHSLADWYWNFRYEGHSALVGTSVLKLFLVFADPAAALHLALSVTGSGDPVAARRRVAVSGVVRGDAGRGLFHLVRVRDDRPRLQPRGRAAFCCGRFSAYIDGRGC